MTLTGGERGDILNPAMNLPGIKENIARVRRNEMAEAAAILGVQHIWLGYTDSGLHLGRSPSRPPDGSFALVPLEESTGRLVKAIRDFKPHVMITYDEHGGYPHPDHIRCHQISLAAYEISGDPHRYPFAGEPWTVSKIYYIHEPIRVSLPMIKVANQLERFQRAVLGVTQRDLVGERTRLSGRTWSLRPNTQLIAMIAIVRQLHRRITLLRIVTIPGGWILRSHRVTTQITCSDYLEQRDNALRAHATQVDPNGLFFAIPMEWRQRLWPTEKFELANTRVTTSRPETDLFAGITMTADQATDGLV